jgi:formate/nitrite transporter FocA (FNT family)
MADAASKQSSSGSPGRNGTDDRGDFSRAEADDIEERSNPRPQVVYEILRREGEAEMDRPFVSLWWSGLAAGLSLAFSLVAEGALRARLPDAPWRPLIARAGYSVGFVIVVLGRQQLFTENTITALLPVAKDVNLRTLMRMGRLWGIVLAANLAGVVLAALFCRFAPAFTPDIATAMLDVAREGLQGDPLQMFVRAIPAGFLVAAMVWLLPTAGAAQFSVVVLMTYLISIGGFEHVIAGSFDAFLLMLSGGLTLQSLIAGFFLPVLAGNVVGGTGLFALLSYGQVAQEV